MKDVKQISHDYIEMILEDKNNKKLLEHFFNIISLSNQTDKTFIEIIRILKIIVDDKEERDILTNYLGMETWKLLERKAYEDFEYGN